MTLPKFVGLVFEYEAVHGGRNVRVVSGSDRDGAEVERWCRDRVRHESAHVVWEVWEVGDKSERLIRDGWCCLTAQAWHRGSAAAGHERDVHFRLQRAGSTDVESDPTPPAPEVSEDWLGRWYESLESAPAVEVVAGENMAYMVLVFGYETPASPEPNFLRCLTYTDPRGLAETVEGWQGRCGSAWVREAWALWGDNERQLEGDSGCPEVIRVHAASRRADAYRDMCEYSSKLMMGMVPMGDVDAGASVIAAADAAADALKRKVIEVTAAMGARSAVPPPYGEPWDRAEANGTTDRANLPDATGNKMLDEMLDNGTDPQP